MPLILLIHWVCMRNPLKFTTMRSNSCNLSDPQLKRFVALTIHSHCTVAVRVFSPWTRLLSSSFNRGRQAVTPLPPATKMMPWCLNSRALGVPPYRSPTRSKQLLWTAGPRSRYGVVRIRSECSHHDQLYLYCCSYRDRDFPRMPRPW